VSRPAVPLRAFATFVSAELQQPRQGLEKRMKRKTSSGKRASTSTLVNCPILCWPLNGKDLLWEVVRLHKFTLTAWRHQLSTLW
jgi:hypothetical protein